MEAIVATSIFAIATTGIVGVYTAVSRLNQKSTALQTVQQNVRFIMEDITKTVRNGAIDYANPACYPGGIVPQPQSPSLCIRDKDNIPIRIYRTGNNLIIDKTGIGSTNYNGVQVRILDFQTHIWPDRDPFAVGAGGALEQPTVTVFMDLESNINQRDIVRIPFQFTAATRLYPE